MNQLGLDAFACVTDDPGHCITCSDEGVPMRVVALDDELELATCEDETGARCPIDIALLDDLTLGATLLAHAGTAIAVLDNDEGGRV